MHASILDTLLTWPQRRHVHTSNFKTVRTSASMVPYTDTGGDKPVILMTPDAPCIIEHHEPLISHLENDFRVICFELPGCGLSYPRAGYKFTVRETADVIVEFMDALAIDRAVLNFTCVNGLHALNLSSRFPERVSHLVLGQLPSMDDMRGWTEHNIPGPLRVPYIGQAVCRMTRQTLSDKWFSISLPRQSSHKEQFSEISRNSLKAGGCFCLASITQGALKSPDADMLGVQQPTLMIHGDSDFSHRHSEFGSLKRTVPHAEILAFEKCGHFPNLENPGAFAKALKDFVQK